MELTRRDLAELERRGIEPSEIQRQLACLREGFPPAAIVRPATVGDGIETLDAAASEGLLRRWREAADAGRLMRFVPASGAASRMFQLLERARHGEPVDTEALDRFFAEVDRFAFTARWKSACAERSVPWNPASPEARVAMLAVLLDRDGMDFACIPKGLVEFHAPDRTPFLEHLAEARDTVADADGRARVHFTVAPEYRAAIEAALRDAGDFEIGYSEQSPSTDTIAATLDGEPFRDAEGALLFRPGGHGSLIENLEALGGDVVLLKNIDNVATGERGRITREWDRRLIGVLLQRQEMAHRWWQHLAEPADEVTLTEVARFVRAGLHRGIPASVLSAPASERQAWLREVLARPLRVCGMVRNEGEPGGGPFWVRTAAGGESLQIVESSQIDHDDPEQERHFQAATHFNPVQLVCGLRDPRGRPIALGDFVDPQTGFVAVKSKDGVSLKALERPGLWNGAMAHWNTIFVEVPIETFNPVKTVLDLLRPAHQG